jgi:hypothetical protein
LKSRQASAVSHQEKPDGSIGVAPAIAERPAPRRWKSGTFFKKSGLFDS